MIFLLISESNIPSAQRSECQILDTLDFRYGDMFGLLWATEYIICFVHIITKYRGNIRRADCWLLCESNQIVKCMKTAESQGYVKADAKLMLVCLPNDHFGLGSNFSLIC